MQTTGHQLHIPPVGIVVNVPGEGRNGRGMFHSKTYAQPSTVPQFLSGLVVVRQVRLQLLTPAPCEVIDCEFFNQRPH